MSYFKTIFSFLLIKLFLFGFNESKKSTNSLKTQPLLDNTSKLSSTIDKIYKKLQSTQCEKEIRFRQFPLKFGENKGLYRSFIHINAMDETNSLTSKLVRKYPKITDMNMFVTNFVVYALLESYEYKGIKQLDKTSLENALTAILDFHDNNYDTKIPIYTFWKQIFSNGTWSQHPENLCSIIENLPDLAEFLIPFPKKIGLDKFANTLETFKTLPSKLVYVYSITPDNDDTSINMALTGIIHKMKDQIDENLTQKWLERNNDYGSLFEYVSKYAYRPFMNESEIYKFSNYSNLLDSRSYYVLHDFLKENQSEDIILPTTWLFDYDKQKKSFPDQSMPFSVNNVDFNVAANFLFGVTNIVLFHPDEHYIYRVFDEDIRKMFSTTVDLILYAIKKDIINKRPDLTILYYPSIFDFYWLASRTYSTLKNCDLKKISDINVRNLFMNAKNKLDDVLKNEATRQIFDKIRKDEDGDYYFMEFLGNYANITRGEDVVFATGLGFNTLINIWTSNVYINETSKFVEKIKFDDTIDVNQRCKISNEDITTTVHKLANYIIKSFDSRFASFEGAFFSGSVKSLESFEVFFPSNFNEYLNGTKVEDITIENSYDYTTASGVRGFIDDEKYQKMLDQVFYGRKVPKNFSGFNPNIFPYWSSPAVAYSVNLLGLSKYNLIIN